MRPRMGAGAAVDNVLTPGKYPVVDQLIHGMARITVGTPSANAGHKRKMRRLAPQDFEKPIAEQLLVAHQAPRCWH